MSQEEILNAVDKLEDEFNQRLNELQLTCGADIAFAPINYHDPKFKGDWKTKPVHIAVYSGLSGRFNLIR